MVSKLSKEGGFRKGLEVFQALPELGIAPDTAITNSAISACDKGAPQRTCCQAVWRSKADCASHAAFSAIGVEFL